MPIYRVLQTFTLGKAEPQQSERLVDAPNKARAIAHVAAATISAEPVSIDDAMRLATAGVSVEKAQA